MTQKNGTGDVTLMPPPAEAKAKALPPGGSAAKDGAPEFILITEFGPPVVYRKYMEDATDAED